MRMFLSLSLFTLLYGFIGFYSDSAECREVISTRSAESEVVTVASGKTISVKSVCPVGTVVLGGGGDCYGYLVTEGWVSLTKSAPLPGESSWYVECVNSNTRPGDIQAKAWAICADPAVFKTNIK